MVKYPMWRRVRNTERTVESWLDAWPLLYEEAKELDLPDIADNRAQIDFLFAVSKHPEFAGYWRQEIARRERLAIKEPPPSLKELVTDFRT
jgi:hypothetical protein